MDAAVQVDRVGGLLFITITEWEDGCCCFNQWFRVSAMVKCYIPELFISQTVTNTFSSELNEKKKQNKKNSFFVHCFFFLIQCAYQTINVAKNETLRLISGRHLISYI